MPSVCMHVHEIELKSGDLKTGDLNTRTIMYVWKHWTHTHSLTTSSIESKKAR